MQLIAGKSVAVETGLGLDGSSGLQGVRGVGVAARSKAGGCSAGLKCIAHANCIKLGQGNHFTSFKRVFLPP